MTEQELQDIRARYDRLCALADESPTTASHACALAYSIDVPQLLEEIDRLKAAA